MSESNTGRNSNDVILELVNLHVKLSHNEGNPVSADELEDVYLKYYELHVNRKEKLTKMKTQSL